MSQSAEMKAAKKKTTEKKKKKTVKKKACQCAEKADKSLEKYNACLVRSQLICRSTGKISLGAPQLMIEKLDTKKRKRLPTVLCKYCPVCGKKFPE